MSKKDKVRREVLPIPDKPYMGFTTFDAKDPDTHFPPFEPLRPPEGAPNVLVILLDDVGFGASSAFARTFHLEAANGLLGTGVPRTILPGGRVRLSWKSKSVLIRAICPGHIPFCSQTWRDFKIPSGLLFSDMD